jgi:hypothetical protein
MPVSKMRIGLSTVLALAAVTAGAESMRCGSKVITVGMAMSEVLQYCGEPASREVEEHDIRSGNRIIGKTQLHRWTYSSYNRHRVLEFDQEKLLSIR